METLEALLAIVMVIVTVGFPLQSASNLYH